MKRKLANKALALAATLAMIVGLMPGMAATAFADDAIGVGSTWLTGDMVNLGGKWIYDNNVAATDSEHNQKMHCADYSTQVVVPSWNYIGIEMWAYQGIYLANNRQYGLALAVPSDSRRPENFEQPLDRERPSGFRVKSGDGTESNPFMFELVYAPTGVYLNYSTLSLDENGSANLTATVQCDYQGEDSTDKRVKWESDKPTVATVDNTGKVTAVGGGTATITVTTAAGKRTDTCVVTVKGQLAPDPTPETPASDSPSDPESPTKITPSPVNSVAMHRLYNPNSGEHLYTASDSERDSLTPLGWRYEGKGWDAPEKSSTPVFRLYNPNSGDHHYTPDAQERDWLKGLGWSDEGTGWYSDDAQGVPVYRQFNPNAWVGTHNYTTSKEENDWLVSLGWRAEGTGWYGVK